MRSSIGRLRLLTHSEYTNISDRDISITQRLQENSVTNLSAVSRR